MSDEILKADLITAGITPEVLETAIAIDAVLQNWRRRVSRRELGSRAIADLGLDIDLAQLDVLMAIYADSREFAPDESNGVAETMVATVASRLWIDPSRASRLVAELIQSGHVRRAASQADARRTIVELTPAGAAIVAKVRRYKFLIMGTFLQGWTAEEIATFQPLLDRFSAWSDGAETDRSGALAAQIALLRDWESASPDAASVDARATDRNSPDRPASGGDAEAMKDDEQQDRQHDQRI